MTQGDEEAVERAAAAVRQGSVGQGWAGSTNPSPADIIRQHVGEDQSADFGSREYRLLRAVARRLGLGRHKTLYAPARDQRDVYEADEYGMVVGRERMSNVAEL